MKQFDPLRLLVWLAVLALGVGILFVVGLVVRALSPVLLLFGLALIVAFVLTPVVSVCEQRFRLPRPVGALMAHLLVVVVLAVLGLMLAPALVDQARQLATLSIQVTRGLNDPASPWYAAAERLGLEAGMSQAVATLVTQLQSMADDLARVMLVLARSFGTALLDLVLLFVISYYMLTARPARLALAQWLAPEQRPLLGAVGPEVADTLARYLRARFLLSVLVGTLVGLAAWAIGLPYPAILGAVAGVFELIPFIGPIFGALPAILVAAVEGPPWRIGAVIFAFVIIQQLEGNVLAPKVTAEAVRLHPLVVIFAVLAAAEVSGPWGAVLVTPILGCAVAAGRAAWNYRTQASGVERPNSQTSGWQSKVSVTDKEPTRAA